jgi:CDP-paratose 2-epimerase
MKTAIPIHGDGTVPPGPRKLGRRPILVTGGAGFIGSNLADRLATDGHDVLVYDALARAGVESNLAWLKSRHPARISVAVADVRDTEGLAEAVQGASAVFHLAAQVAVTTSLADPVDDFDVNLRGTLNLLEAARRSPTKPPVIFASTNKVYGDLADVPLVASDTAYLPADRTIRENGVDERRPLDFHTPYGCSKGAADQYVLDYSRSFGMRTAVLRMSCIYGPRQMGTEDQGWVAHFALKALAGEPITVFGDGRQVRDVLDVADVVAAYAAALARIDQVRGQAFNMGGGPAHAVSLRQVIAHLEEITGRQIETVHDDWRSGDQRYYVSDTRLARQALGLGQFRPWKSGVAGLVEWLERGDRDEPVRVAAAGPFGAEARS